MKRSIQKHKKTLFALTLLAALVVGGAFYVHKNNEQKTAQTEQQKLQQQEQQHQKDISSSGEKSPDTGKPGDATTGPAASPQAASATSLQKPTITRASQGGSGVVSVAAIVGGTSSGTCTAKFSKGSSTISRVTNVQQVTNYYACGEFDVPKSDFPSTGDWTVTVTVANNQGSAMSDAKQVTVN